MERKYEINTMLNEIRRLSPEKREKIGRAINNLNGKNLGKELGFNRVKYGRKKSFESEINIGDLVLISKGDPLKSKLTGTVTEKGNRFIIIAIENVPPWALKNVRIDLYANDITFRRMKENLNNLSISGKKALEFLFKYDFSPLKFDDRKSNEKDDENNNYDNTTSFIDFNLNKSQQNAISQALISKDFFLIHGPFGTGKTRTLLEIIRQEVKKGSKILATAESNTAVDNILEGLLNEDISKKSKLKINCLRLGHPQRVSQVNIQHTLAYKVENHPLNSKIVLLKEGIKKTIKEREKHTKPTPGFRRGLSDTQILLNAVKRRGTRGVSPNVMMSMGRWIENNKKVDQAQQKIQEIEKSMVEDITKKASVVLCTNSSAGLEYLNDIKFDLAVIDESSQATIPSVLIPISKAKRFILAGDHRQLPPTIMNHQARELEKTLFEGLINNYPKNSTMLNIQYRMHPDLMEFPNDEFYGGKIKAGNSINHISIQDIVFFNANDDKSSDNEYNEYNNNYNSQRYVINDDNLNPQFKSIQRCLMDPKIPYIFLNTSKIDKRFEKHVKGSTSIQNPLEADLVSLVTLSFINFGINPEKIGIISPYEDQRDLISSLTDVEVKTVDGFQGREKDIMIISTVRSNGKGKIGFLKDLRRLNVALTRARRKMVIIGDIKTLKMHPTYHRLIETSQKKGFLKDVVF